MKKTKKDSSFDYTTITSVEAAFEKAGIPMVKPEDLTMFPEELREAIVGHFNLLVVHNVVNNGWKPNFNDNNWKFYGYHWIEGNSASGFRFQGSGYVISGTLPHLGARLCCPDAEKVRHINKYFEDEWKKFKL